MTFFKDAGHSNGLNKRDTATRPAYLPRQSSYSKRHASFDTPREVPFPSQSPIGGASSAVNKTPTKLGIFTSDRSGRGRVDGHELDIAGARVSKSTTSSKFAGMVPRPAADDPPIDLSPLASQSMYLQDSLAEAVIAPQGQVKIPKSYDEGWHTEHLRPPLFRLSSQPPPPPRPSLPTFDSDESPPPSMSASVSIPPDWNLTGLNLGSTSVRRPSTESLPLPSQTPIHALLTASPSKAMMVDLPEVEVKMDVDTMQPLACKLPSSVSSPSNVSSSTTTQPPTALPPLTSSPRPDQHPPTFRSLSSPSLDSASSTLFQRFMDSRPRPSSTHSVSSSSRSTSSPSIPPPSPPTIHTPPPLDDILGSVADGFAHETASNGSKRKRAPHEPFLSHAPPPVDSYITVETLEHEYRLIVRLPGYKRDCITIATRRRRILHIVADNWDAGGGHFERRISFGYDADLGQVRAEFDGEHLRVVIPRRPPPIQWFGPPTTS